MESPLQYSSDSHHVHASVATCGPQRQRVGGAGPTRRSGSGPSAPAAAAAGQTGMSTENGGCEKEGEQGGEEEEGREQGAGLYLACGTLKLR
jgi:hypothetical protein